MGHSCPSNIAHKFTADLKFLKDAEVVAVGSRDIARARAFAQQFDIARAYGSYEELVGDAE